MGTPSLRAVCATFVVLSAACDFSPKVENSKHAPAIQRLVRSTPAWVDRGRLGSSLWKTERDFYASRHNLPAWIDGDKASPRLGALLDALKHAEDHGLDPARYGTDKFQQMVLAAKENKNRYDMARIPELDARLTYAYLRYAADLLGWSGNPRAIHSTWVVAHQKADLSAQLEKALSSDEVRGSLEELAPSHSQYKGLQSALQRERMNP